MGRACAYHAEKQRESNEQARESNRGINPDAEVTGDLLKISMLVELTPELSQVQKDRIEAILFPLPGARR
jgi:hypothetical protein